MKHPKKIFYIAVFVITGMLFLSFLSCDSEEKLRERYNHGYSNGNKSGYDRGFAEGKTEGQKIGHNEGYESGRRTGHNNGYNVAKNEYQTQINQLENRIAEMEKNHKTELTASYNRGFQAGEVSMENKILAIVDLRAQQAIKRNRKNEPLFTIR
jgi:flagellar biosynthesis/type III secretory pathway protein FliH